MQKLAKTRISAKTRITCKNSVDVSGPCEIDRDSDQPLISLSFYSPYDRVDEVSFTLSPAIAVRPPLVVDQGNPFNVDEVSCL